MDSFTLKYFREETVRFRQAFGDKLIMANQEKKDALIKGYSHVYFNTEVSNEEEKCFLVETFDRTIQEFNRRNMYFMVGI
jgi:hypothetical protein